MTETLRRLCLVSHLRFGAFEVVSNGVLRTGSLRLLVVTELQTRPFVMAGPEVTITPLPVARNAADGFVCVDVGGK
jgi:hypothetical protein